MPPSVQGSFVIPGQTAVPSKREQSLVHETTQRLSESAFSAAPNKGAQTGCVPNASPSGLQENGCSVSPTPKPGALLAVHVSPACNCARFSGPNRFKRLSIDSHKKICGTSTKCLYPDPQQTVPISATYRRTSPLSLVGHTRLLQGLAQRHLDHCSRSLWLHTVLSRKRLPGFEEIGMISASSIRLPLLWPGNHHCLSNGPVAHIEHMGVSA